jgi:magnesium chelatase family protein
VAGLHNGGGLVRERPMRAPHHTISAPGLVGGGSTPAPGEASLAHHGVLFLDELSEFSRAALEALRQPLEDGVVAIVRGQRTVIFPSRFQLIASTNPCPCGLAGTDACRCSEGDLARHRRRLSGPLLDRLDILVDMPRPSASEIGRTSGTCTAAVRESVMAARERQAARLAGTGATTNAELTAGQLDRFVRADARALAVLQRAYAQGDLSARGRGRVLRVARTIADLAGDERVRAKHVNEALGLRQRDILEGVQAA